MGVKKWLFVLCVLFVSLCSGAINLGTVTFHAHVRQCSGIRDYQQKIGKMSGSQYSRRVCNQRFIDCLQQNVGELVYSISSRSSGSGYSALMLTKGAQVDYSLTRQLWVTSVNISAEYPVLPNHDAMNTPSIHDLLAIPIGHYININILKDMAWCLPPS